MTLLEVVVFMTLTLFVLGGSFPLITRLRYADKAHEERLAAINLAASTIETLRATPYTQLTHGYAKRTSSTGGIYYEKYYSKTNFYANALLNMRIRLYEQNDATMGDYYRGEIRLRWDVKRAANQVEHAEETFTALLFPDV